MGLLSGILTLPLAPVRGVVWVADRLVEAAEREIHDPAVIRARLASLNRDLEDGLIGAGEFEQEEERLLDLLEERPRHAAVRSAPPPVRGRPGGVAGRAAVPQSAVCAPAEAAR